jgi:hypothetical protein
MAISQGVGVSVAAGVRPFLVALAVGALARANAGVDFEGSGWGFLESFPWLAAMLVLIVLAVAAGRRRLTVPAQVLAVAAIAIGAVEFAGSLAEEDYAAAPGLVAGAACALLATAAARAFFGRAAARARAGGEDEAATLVELLAIGPALVLAALAVLVSPVSWIALAFCAWILLVQRRRAGRKYEGLRILR